MEDDRELIDDINVPFELRAKHFDILIVSSEADAERANKLKGILKRFVEIKRNGISIPVEVATIYDSDDFYEISNIHDRIDFALSRSTFYMILITNSASNDDVHTMMSHTAISECLHNKEKNYCIFPVYEDREEFLQTTRLKYLKCFEGIRLNKFLKNQSLDDIEVDSLCETSIYAIDLGQLKNLVRSRYGQRKNRETETKKKLENFREKKRLERELKMEADNLRHQKQLEAIQLNSAEALKDIADNPCDSGLGDSLDEDVLRQKILGSPKIIASSSNNDPRTIGMEDVARASCSSQPPNIIINVFNNLSGDSVMTTDAIKADDNDEYVLVEEDEEDEIPKIALPAVKESTLNKKQDALVQKPQAIITPFIKNIDLENQNVGDDSNEQTYVKQLENRRNVGLSGPPFTGNFPTRASGITSENVELCPVVMPDDLQPAVSRGSPDENIIENETELKHL